MEKLRFFVLGCAVTSSLFLMGLWIVLWTPNVYNLNHIREKADKGETVIVIGWGSDIGAIDQYWINTDDAIRHRDTPWHESSGKVFRTKEDAVQARNDVYKALFKELAPTCEVEK